MVDPGREDDEISGEALNPNPAILDVSHVEVTGAEIENGLLHIDLKRELPEAMKPRTIKIKGAAKSAKLIEDKKAA